MDKKHCIIRKGDLELILNITQRYVELYKKGVLVEIALSTGSATRLYNEVKNDSYIE